MIYVSDTELKILRSILQAYPVPFYVFGSRVKGTQQQFSDLDLCYKQALSNENLSQLREALENSDLPFIVDLVDYKSCSESFRQLIDRDGVELRV